MPLDNISELRRRVPGGKYALARAVAERARQLQSGATPLVEVRTPNPLSVAIDEIVQGKVSFNIETQDDVDVREAAEDAALTAPKKSASVVDAEAADVPATDALLQDATADGLA